MWAKQQHSDDEYNPIGVQPGNEILNDWVNYNILLMSKNHPGNHLLVKSCVSKAEGQMIAFVVEMNEQCKPKIDSVKKFETENGQPAKKKSANTDRFFTLIQLSIKCLCNLDSTPILLSQ